MPVQPPILDSRDWQQLRDELVRRIPVHAPEWTDHSPADPGIALLELFAHLGESLLGSLNRAPDAAQLAFLNLLQLPPRPAASARVQLRLMLPKGGIEPETPDFSTTAPRLECSAGPISFEVEEEVTILPVEVLGFVKARHEEAVPPEGTEAVNQLLESHLGAAPGALSAYRTVPMPEVKGGALPEATSSGGTLDGRIWLCLLAPPDALATLVPRTPAEALAVLRERISGRVLNLALRSDDALCGSADVLRCPDPGAHATPWPIRAEISTGRFRGAAKRVDHAVFDRLAVVQDNTEGLTRSGTLRLRLPDLRNGVPRLGDWTADSFDPADEDLLGVGPLPPRLDDPKLASRVLAWIVLRRVDASDPPIRLRLVQGNGVGAVQAVTMPAETLGHGEGRPGQQVTLSRAPVIAGSELVQLRGATGWEAWTRLPDFAEAGPDDPVYLLDPGSGAITFGDGLHGRLPLPGEAIRCLGYRSGGGVRGNVPAAAVKRVKNARVALRVENALPAEGGQDAETLPEATLRIPKVLRSGERAVAAEDFTALALETPGAQLGRAHVLPRHKPQQRADGVPGTVTLIVLPASDPVTPETPTPDREMLRRVCAHLESRRLVTTELYVTPPEYVPFDLSIAVEAEPGTGGETLKRWVELALRQHFAPLPPYGPDGGGWPFGRAVRDRDAEAAALRVQGVRLVNEVLLEGEAIAPDGTTEAAEGSVPMRAWQLPVLRSVSVTIGEKAEPITPEPPPPMDGMPVPVEQEKC